MRIKIEEYNGNTIIVLDFVNKLNIDILMLNRVGNKHGFSIVDFEVGVDVRLQSILDEGVSVNVLDLIYELSILFIDFKITTTKQ